MKFLLSTVLIVVVFPALCFAERMSIPLDELVQDSDLIVIGTLENVSEYSQVGRDYGSGTISVEEVIWSEATPRQILTLRWDNASDVICPRVEHGTNQGGRGIWLLTLAADGSVRADYPGRFLLPEQKGKVETILRRKKISARLLSQHQVSIDEPVKVSFVFRNPTNEELAFPGLEFRDGQLHLTSQSKLTLTSGLGEGRKRLEPLAEKLVVSENLLSIVVGPRQERRVTLDLSTLFKIDEQNTYSMNFLVTGHEPANEIRFYVNLLKGPEMATVTIKEQPVKAPQQSAARETHARPFFASLAFVGFFLLYRFLRS